MTYRKSHYCIDVKLEKAEGKYMLVHSYTGALDIVSEELVLYLKKTKEFDKESFPFSDNTFDLLAKRGHITQRTFEEEREHVIRFATLLHKEAKMSPYKYMFMVSYDCNFRCAYCYEAGISQQGNKWSKKRFTKKMVDRAYEVMTELSPRDDTRAKQIMLYGGEPLMKENIDIVEYIVDKGTALGYVFRAVTNGYDLACFEHLLAKGAIKDIQITLDGNKQMHDNRRYHYENGSSFDVIFRNIGLALSCGVIVNVRFNADRRNFPEAKQLKQLFDNAGYSKSKLFNFYTAILRNNENNVNENGSLMDVRSKDSRTTADNAIAYLNIDEFKQMQKEIGIEANHRDYKLYRSITSAINNGSYIRFNSIACDSQSNMLILDPYGHMYSCWETVGVKQYTVGDYSNEIVWQAENNNWRNKNIGNTIKCDACKYGLFCGGGCLAKTLRLKKRFKRAICADYKDTFASTINMVFDGMKSHLGKQTMDNIVQK